ncbi:MAG: sigma-70 family RNA polymerase sigma factor [Pseudomonadota bacterium]
MVVPDEADLVARIERGDATAFQVVLRDQLPGISHYVARMLGNSTEAEDITQEVFLRLWTQAGRFDPSKAKLSTWLYNIAHNLCIDYFRKHNRLVSENNFEDAVSTDEPDTSHYDGLRAKEVEASIMQLPERQRSALVMCHYQGLSNKDAADILDVSVDALESLLSRARRKLKTLLSDYSTDKT